MQALPLERSHIAARAARACAHRRMRPGAARVRQAVVVLIAGALFGVFAPRADAADLEPPQVAAISYSPASVDTENADATVTVTIHSTDNVGVTSGWVRLRKLNDNG